jgi:hypothetical protein
MILLPYVWGKDAKDWVLLQPFQQEELESFLFIQLGTCNAKEYCRIYRQAHNWLSFLSLRRKPISYDK